jgi:hypothetical protein
MEFVVACGRRRGPPLERLAAHGAILHFGQCLHCSDDDSMLSDGRLVETKPSLGRVDVDVKNLFFTLG